MILVDLTTQPITHPYAHAPATGGPIPPRGANFECFVYEPGSYPRALCLTDFNKKAWPILQGLKEPHEKENAEVPLVALTCPKAAAVAADLTAAGIASLPIPKSMGDLFYLHALLTDMAAVCRRPPTAAMLKWQDSESLLAYGLLCSMGLAVPHGSLTHTDITETLWQVLADFQLLTAVPHLTLDPKMATPKGLTHLLHAQINDPRYKTATWALHRYVVDHVLRTLGGLNPMGDAQLLQMGTHLLGEIATLQSGLKEQNWQASLLVRVWPAYGQTFASMHMGPKPWRHDVEGRLVLQAIAHEVAASPSCYSLYRTADLHRDIMSQRNHEVHLLSFSTSALMGSLFDGTSGCCVSLGFTRTAKQFYVCDVQADQSDIHTVLYLPPVRGMHRMVESGEWLHPRLKCIPPPLGHKIWGGVDTRLGSPAPGWAHYLFLSGGPQWPEETAYVLQAGATTLMNFKPFMPQRCIGSHFIAAILRKKDIMVTAWQRWMTFMAS
jgi:hypothetical protein